MTDTRKWVLSHNHVTGQYVVGPEGEDGVVVADAEQGQALVAAHNDPSRPARVSEKEILKVMQWRLTWPSVHWRLPCDDTLRGLAKAVADHLNDTAALCESGNADCGPVVWHDGDGVAMCARCLIATVGDNALSTTADLVASAAVNYVSMVLSDSKYGHDVEWVRANLRPDHLREVALAPIEGTPAPNLNTSETHDKDGA